MSGRHHPFLAVMRPLFKQLAPVLQGVQVAKGSGFVFSLKFLPSLSLPGIKLYVFISHKKQNLRSLGRCTLPISQAVQFDEPAFDCILGKQSMQVVEPVAEVNCPASQLLQSGWPGKS